MANGDIKAGELFYNIVAKYDPNFQSNIVKADKNVSALGKSFEKTDSKAESFGNSLKGLGKIIGLGFIINAVKNFGVASVQAFSNAQQSTIQFNNALQNVGGTTKEQINDLNEYINVLEKKTSIDDKSIRQSAQILAQDQIKAENIKKLLPQILDLAVANSKANGGEVDAAGTAKAIGLAFAEGSLGRLTKQNIAGISESQKKLFELGTEAERTAILMQILDENAKGASEALGNSFQGKLNKGKDLIEDLQVAIGGGLSLALVNMSDELSTVGKGLEITTKGSDDLAFKMFYASNVLAIVIKTFKTLASSLLFVGKTFVGVGNIALGFAKDTIANFKQVASAVTDLGGALINLFKGDFEGAKIGLTNAFNFKQVTSNVEIALADLSKTVLAGATDVNDSFLSLGDTSLNSDVLRKKFEKLRTEQALVTKASDSLKEKTNETSTSIKKAGEETEKTKEKLNSFKQKLVDVTNQSKKTSSDLNENLNKSFSDFGNSLSETLNETQAKLSDIVIKAEERKKELQNTLSQGVDENATKELAQVQKVLDARVGYETRASQQIADVKKKIQDAGLDPTSLNLEKILANGNFEKQLAEERINASLDEFTLFEKQQNDKILKLTESFISESSIIKAKIDTQKSLEADLTLFLASENANRLASIENFAQASISKYGEVASSLKDLISLQNQVSALTQPASLPQFHNGGFVSSTGQVHAGEYVIPANMVAGNSALISALEKGRTQNNSIVINGANTAGGDLKTITEQMLWQLNRS